MISSLRPLFHSCSKFDIVSGKRISFWFDGWAGQPLLSPNAVGHRCRTISLFDARDISLHLLPRPLTLHMHLAMQSMAHFQPQPGFDRIRWTISSCGQFTVKSVYKILSEAGKTRSLFPSIWRAKTTPSMRLFFFFLLNNRLLTHDVMLRRNLQFTPGCVMCSDHSSETLPHLFFQCAYATRVWSTLSASVGYPLIRLRDTTLLTVLASAPLDKQHSQSWLTLFICVTWSLWKERNARTFRQSCTPSSVLATNILQDAALCSRFC